MSEYTKGPWSVKEQAPDTFVYEVMAGKIGSSSCRGGVAFCDDKANAQLIAATPELLEALEEVTEQLRLFMELHDDDEDAPVAYDKAIAAISKAKGE